MKDTKKTLRDSFAIAALQALIVKSPFLAARDSTEEARAHLREANARGAYDYADAMLAQREVRP